MNSSRLAFTGCIQDSWCMMAVYYPIPIDKDKEPSGYEVSLDFKNYRLKPEETQIIHECPYCETSVSSEGRLVVFDGVVYAACPKGTGCNADYQPGIGGWLFGSLFYDVPMMVFAFIVIIFAHFMFSPYADGAITAQIVLWLKIFIYGTVSIVLPVGMYMVSGLPFILTIVVMPIYSWWMIFG